jgi:hypothetical protein
MLVRLRIWFDIASNVGGTRTSAVDPFVTFDRGESTSLLAIFCKASIVADCGGVFSPSMLCGGLLNDGRIVGVSRLGVSRPLGVEDLERLVSFSGDLPSCPSSLYVCGVVGLGFSGDLGALSDEPPSIILLKSLTVPV